jgi:FixJ family two-component response regulator
MPKDGIPTICIVDGDDAVRDSLRLLLEAEGFAARTFASLSGVLERFRPPRKSCLLVELQPPVEHTLDLLVRFRRSWSHPKIIVMTGNRDDGSDQLVRRAGASALIEKPFHSAELLRIIFHLMPM